VPFLTLHLARLVELAVAEVTLLAAPLPTATPTLLLAGLLPADLLPTTTPTLQTAVLVVLVVKAVTEVAEVTVGLPLLLAVTAVTHHPHLLAAVTAAVMVVVATSTSMLTRTKTKTKTKVTAATMAVAANQTH
jgi:hypothetical protein